SESLVDAQKEVFPKPKLSLDIFEKDVAGLHQSGADYALRPIKIVGRGALVTPRKDVGNHAQHPRTVLHMPRLGGPLQGSPVRSWTGGLSTWGLARQPAAAGSLSPGHTPGVSSS